MALRDDLLPLLDTLRAIPAELGFRQYEVYVRVTINAGLRPGHGAQSVTETRLLVGGQNPKVREVRRKDIVAGDPSALSAEYEIGPLTPEFGSGGIAESTINPEHTNTPTTIHYVIKGPGLPEDGLLCKRMSEHNDRPLRTMIRVQSIARKRPT